MSYGFVGSALEAAKSLNFVFFAGANRAQAAADDIRCDEEKYGVHLLHIPMCRSPFSYQNVKAYKQLCKIIRENKIDYIHCNTPVGGMLGRLAGKKCGVKKVIYQAHGFHFYKGAPKKNWLLYYPIEKWLARYTDALITINQEDYEIAQKKFKLRNNGNVYYVPGVGIETKAYQQDSDMRQSKRKSLSIPENAFVMVSVGELNANKNNSIILDAIKMLGRTDVHYVLCGVGPHMEALQRQADELGLSGNIHFLGYRKDVAEIYTMADCFVSASLREGLPRATMEAMASGLPCIASRIRGNTDLLDEGKGGFLCDAADAADFADKLSCLVEDETLRRKMGEHNKIAVQRFDTEKVKCAVLDVYQKEIIEA